MSGLLIERLRREGCVPPAGCFDRLLRRLEAALPPPRVFVIDPVLDVIAGQAETQPEAPLWTVSEHWADLTPPAPAFFMEFTAPAALHEPPTSRGVLVRARDLESGGAPPAAPAGWGRARCVREVIRGLSLRPERDELAWWNCVVEEALPSLDERPLEQALARRPPQVRWWLEVAPYVEAASRVLLAPSLVWYVALDAAGRILQRPDGRALIAMRGTSGEMDSDAVARLSEDLLPSIFHPCMFAINLINQPGVRTVETPGRSRGHGQNPNAPAALEFSIQTLDLSDWSPSGGEEEWPDVIGG